jgi:hypothetical protein
MWRRSSKSVLGFIEVLKRCFCKETSVNSLLLTLHPLMSISSFCTIYAYCKGTSVHFLTSPLLSYSPLVHMYFPHTFVPSPGTTPKADDFRIQSPMTFRMSTHRKSLTFRSFLCSYLNSIGWASDALGQVRVTLWHPPLSRGQLFMGGLVLGGLVL